MQTFETDDETTTMLAELGSAVERDDAAAAVSVIERQSRIVCHVCKMNELRWAIEVASFPPGQRSGTQRIAGIERLKDVYDAFVDGVGGIDGALDLIAPALDDANAAGAHPLLALILMRDARHRTAVARRAVEIWDASVPEPQVKKSLLRSLAGLLWRGAAPRTYRPAEWHRYLPNMFETQAKACGESGILEVSETLNRKLERLEADDRRQGIVLEAELVR